MAKKIIICTDGTWNSPHGIGAVANDTNVRKLYCALADSPDQMRYYDSGVGTDGTPIDHLAGGAMGEGLFQKVQDGYEFLAYVWDPGDQIYIFGFSRGAYTARSLGGMIAGFGVPTKNFDNRTVQKIFSAYRQTDPKLRVAAKDALDAEYRLTAADVRMIGVWDTVGSLGVPGLLFSVLHQQKYGFLDTSLHPCVKSAFHAICIDERRAPFKPTLWTNADGSPRDNDDQVQQVWFSGVHCDDGGGYDDCRLSEITLGWMLKNAIKCGLVFDEDARSRYLKIDPSSALGAAHDEWKMVPWGFPEHREIPANAAMANTVQMRLDGMAEYRPENLTLTEAGKLKGYQVVDVLA
ncbi:DUF2235 domain-containing protein [Edaphobacter paludis]|uniref:DUF2235 domain-containing protein n=1 Tax=Edaphobacter paludis TaxID=3035702 RepID=A0AAU7CWS3_9BACT